MRPKYPLIMLTAFILASVHLAQAQQPAKVPRIGFLSSGSLSSTREVGQVEAFRQGLQELGYVEGRNIVIEYRYADFGHEDVSLAPLYTGVAERAELTENVVRFGLTYHFGDARTPSYVPMK